MRAYASSIGPGDTMKTLAALGLALVASTAFAKDLDPTEAVQIEREQEAATKKVNAAHGDKKPSEMDPEERAQVIDEERKARLEVLDRHGVSDKEFSRYQGKLTPEQRVQEKAAAKALDAKEAAAKAHPAADPNAAKPPDQVVVQYGNATQAVDLKTGKPLPASQATPTVERGGSEAPAPRHTSRHHTSRSHHRRHHGH
jgi:hypothetical protein